MTASRKRGRGDERDVRAVEGAARYRPPQQEERSRGASVLHSKTAVPEAGNSMRARFCHSEFISVEDSCCMSHVASHPPFFQTQDQQEHILDRHEDMTLTLRNQTQASAFLLRSVQRSWLVSQYVLARRYVLVSNTAIGSSKPQTKLIWGSKERDKMREFNLKIVSGSTRRKTASAQGCEMRKRKKSQQPTRMRTREEDRIQAANTQDRGKIEPT